MKGSDVESLTKLLKAHGVRLSAVRANRLLMELGLLEEATRESATRPGVTKTYKVVTEAGLDFGVNEENPQSPGQSSPYWYKDSFGELAARLLAADAGATGGGATRGGKGESGATGDETSGDGATAGGASPGGATPPAGAGARATPDGPAGAASDDSARRAGEGSEKGP